MFAYVVEHCDDVFVYGVDDFGAFIFVTDFELKSEDEATALKDDEFIEVCLHVDTFRCEISKDFNFDLNALIEAYKIAVDECYGGDIYSDFKRYSFQF
jgi:hypothetical protein